MNILDKIIAQKKTEVAAAKKSMPLAALEKEPGFQRNCLSLYNALQDAGKTGIIAEFKRRSPSKGLINGTADAALVTGSYAQHGASAVSVLTDELYFGGTQEDLRQARQHEVPILRKDFMIDDYQLYEAKAMGADVILLIASCLSPAAVQRMAALTRQLGMEALLEIHDESELGHMNENTRLVGINNRNLKDFSVDINRSIALAEKIPAGVQRIAESGIDNVETICTFKQSGFTGFLMGERFMKAPDPAIAFADFVQQLKAKENESQSMRHHPI